HLQGGGGGAVRGSRARFSPGGHFLRARVARAGGSLGSARGGGVGRVAAGPAGRLRIVTLDGATPRRPAYANRRAPRLRGVGSGASGPRPSFVLTPVRAFAAARRLAECSMAPAAWCVSKGPEMSKSPSSVRNRAQRGRSYAVLTYRQSAGIM